MGCHTLYGSLSILSKLSNFENTSILAIYRNIISWVSDANYWILNTISTSKLRGETVNLECLEILLSKVDEVYRRNQQFLNDSIPHIFAMLQNSKTN